MKIKPKMFLFGSSARPRLTNLSSTFLLHLHLTSKSASHRCSVAVSLGRVSVVLVHVLMQLESNEVGFHHLCIIRAIYRWLCLNRLQSWHTTMTRTGCRSRTLSLSLFGFHFFFFIPPFKHCVLKIPPSCSAFSVFDLHHPASWCEWSFHKSVEKNFFN